MDASPLVHLPLREHTLPAGHGVVAEQSAAHVPFGPQCKPSAHVLSFAHATPHTSNPKPAHPVAPEGNAWVSSLLQLPAPPKINPTAIAAGKIARKRFNPLLNSRFDMSPPIMTDDSCWSLSARASDGQPLAAAARCKATAEGPK